MQAAGELGTDQDHGFRLATDSTVPYQAKEPPPVSKEMATWLRKAGLDLAQTYTVGEIDTALAGAGLGLEQRLAVKAEMYDRKRILASSVRPTPRPMQGQRDMSGGADRRILRDASGEPVTLRFGPV